MRIGRSIVVIIVLSMTLLSCNGKAENNGNLKSEITKEIPSLSINAENGESLEQKAKPYEIEDLPLPVSLEERFSYTYGYLLMEAAKRDVKELIPHYFARGALDSGLQTTALLDKNTMNNVLYEYQDKLIAEASKRLEELARKNLEDAESFLAVNGKREKVVTTASGLQYEVIKDAEGDKPKENDTVRVNYRLTYLDGREGDASIRGLPSTFDLSTMIPGFKEGLMLMSVGSTFKFFVHPNLGYGASGSTKIEPNTLLIFDVELVEILN
ncbi:MAG: FKBP-type peptidyl-prolyl cis-trans isomerase [Sphaerochaetaceae bacterium]